MRFSLDTNAIIALMEGQREVIGRLQQHGADAIGLSSIVVHELHFGACRSARMVANSARIDALPFKIFDFNRDDARAGADIRMQLRRQGAPIGHFDLLIAGQALARDLTLVTHNTREFQRVPGLRLADWE
jgi:tRNA(fMet)-specific endonuclease VapC